MLVVSAAACLERSRAPNDRVDHCDGREVGEVFVLLGDAYRYETTEPHASLVLATRTCFERVFDVADTRKRAPKTRCWRTCYTRMLRPAACVRSDRSARSVCGCGECGVLVSVVARV